MEKLKILNIADNLSLLKENHKNYIEVKDKEDFESYNRKKNMYNNWIVTLCDIYNSLLKYYSDDTNEYWDRINLFVSKTYKYENIEITLKELLKKYRNKNVHPENSNSVENSLLAAIVNTLELEELQKMIIDLINYELEKIDKNQIINHVLKSGNNIIAYNMFIEAINKSIKNATSKEMEMLNIPYSTIQNVISVLTDDSVITEEVLNELEKNLDIANDIINSSEFIELMLEQPNGQDALDFLDEIKSSNSSSDIYECCIKFKNKILNKQ